MSRHETLRANANVRAAAIVGERFHRLIVTGAGEPRSGGRYFECVCDCGVKTKSTLGNLKRGRHKSCGCFDRERAAVVNLTHGQSRTPEYEIWKTMRQRCRNPKSARFKDYGARGIAVCNRWDSFENFLTDMGLRPSPKHSIDRYPDNDGNYEPANCRWATAVQQRHNRRDTVSEPSGSERAA